MNSQIKSLNHVALQVSNVGKSMFFYEKILGLKKLESRPLFDFNGAWFDLGNNSSLHLIEGLLGRVNSNSRGSHFAIEIKSIKETETYLKNKNIDCSDTKIRQDGASQIFIIDPDGYCIEFVMLV